ncbi:MAG: domain containing protein [Ignavibacteria bacterium]|nr:domain containing protein [Ignavibacteria bacterium]
MEILFLGIFFCLSGNIFSYLSNLIIQIPEEDNKRTTEDLPGKNKILPDLMTDFEDSPEVLNFLETLFLALGTVSISVYLYSLGFGLSLILLISVFVIILLNFLGMIFGAIGRKNSNNINHRQLSIVRFLLKLTKPVFQLNNFFKRITNTYDNNDVSRGELNALVDNAREDGTLDLGEYRILKNIIKFNDILVSDVMTPRSVVFSCHADKAVGEVVKMTELRMYSRFPIWEGDSFDRGIIGYVLSKDVLHAALMGNAAKKLRSFVRETYFIPENAELDIALEKFLQGRQHLFVVVDEYGGVEGLITMEDVLETMLGVEIVDEADRVVDLREYAKQRRDKRVASLASGME